MIDKPRFNYTVAQLIEKLGSFPSDLPVLVSGYETGYENMHEPRVIDLVHRQENMHWDGEFQQPEKDDEAAFKAVVLDRVMRND